jgi:hypothetical protein
MSRHPSKRLKMTRATQSRLWGGHSKLTAWLDTIERTTCCRDLTSFRQSRRLGRPKMNVLSNATPLSTVSERMLRVGLYLPFAAIIAFALLGLFSVFNGVASRDVSVPHLLILQNQRTLLISQGLARGLSVDLLLLEAFVFAASIVGLFRFLTGAFSARVLDAMGTKAEAYAKAGRSPVAILFGLLILAPIACFCSLHFAGALHSIQLRALLEISPRSFICLSAFMFCGSVMFFVEGLLTLVWVVFVSE